MTAASTPVRAVQRQAPQVAPRNMARLLRMELLRNTMPFVLPLIAVLFWFDSYRIAATMPPLWVERLYYILGQGHALVDFAPFVAGVAAWMGSRDGRRGMTDLVTATVRPRWEAQLRHLGGDRRVGSGGLPGLHGCDAGAPRPVHRLWQPAVVRPIAAGAVGVTAFVSAGFALGAYFPGRFIAPIAAFGALFAMGTSSQIGFSEGSGWALILPTMSNNTFGQDAGIFYPFLPDVAIARVMFAAGIAVALVGLLGLPVGAGGPRLRWSAAVVTAAGAAAVTTAIALTFTARLEPYGTVIPALHDAASDRPIPYTPVCGQAGIPVCVHPAYRSYLPDVTTAVGPVARELTGLPGAPVRATQIATVFTTGCVGTGPCVPTAAQLQVETIGGSPPVLHMALNAVTLPGSFGMDKSGFKGLIRLEFVHAFIGAGGGNGTPAQQVVQAAVLADAGTPLAAQPNVLGFSPWALPSSGRTPDTSYPPQLSAAAQRFAALPAAARHAWLAGHLAALRAGHITPAQLP